MLISKQIEMRWNSKNKHHFTKLGYKFTKMKDTFIVDVNDLTDGSQATVVVKCDYCGKVFTKTWERYKKENIKAIAHTDCCNNCKKHKIIDTTKTKYGVKSVLSLDSIKEKIAETNLEKYGAENPFASEIIKQKISETNIARYGVKRPAQSKDIMNKIIKTCQSKYGVDYYILTQRLCGEYSTVWKGGISTQRNERLTYDYKKWRKSVFDRDLYTCQCCNDRSGKGHNVKLNAHHIYNWKDYSDKRYDVGNGITLCERCHLDFHMEYGKSRNDYNQLKSFLMNYGKKIC